MREHILIIGVSGVTCGGKTTTTTKLKKLIPNSSIISQDDYFLSVDDERHVWIEELNHINFDIISSLDMEQMHKDINNIIKDKHILHYNYNTEVQNFDMGNFLDILNKTQVQVLIIEGFSIFNYKPIVDLFSLKYYFLLDREECFERRKLRVYEPPDCPGYFELCVWPEHLAQLKEVKESVPDVIFLNKSNYNPEFLILKNVQSILEQVSVHS